MLFSGRTPNRLSKTPKFQTPPLIAMLAHLADAPPTTHEPAGKVLSCGHKIDVCSILACSNLFGDREWQGKPTFLECPQPNCSNQHSLPWIPDPWAVDGLRARLDLLQWAWSYCEDAPHTTDVKMARVLRRILDQIGYLPQGIDMTSSSPRGGPSQRRLMQTFGLFDIEGVEGAQGKIRTGPRDLRGTKPYCRFRPSKAPPSGSVPLTYRHPVLGQSCDCEEPHGRAPKARQWASTPAEEEEKSNHAIPRTEKSRKTGKPGQKKTVRFVAPVITEIRYFEPWWSNEYRYSTRYYSSGPCRLTSDRSTRIDDDKEIARLEAASPTPTATKNKRWLPWE